MKRTNRKGFTTVELVIVIAVIAILAAVLIPTFVSLINKANLSADQQAVRNMNLILKQEAAAEGAPETCDEAVAILIKNNYADFNTYSANTFLAWLKDSNIVVLVESVEGAETVLYPKEGEGKTGYERINPAALSVEDLLGLLQDGNGNTVFLGQDMEMAKAEDMVFSGAGDYSLNGGGKTITTNVGGFAVENGANMTLSDIVIEAGSDVSTVAGAYGDGVLTLDNVIISGGNRVGIQAKAGATVTVNNSKVFGAAGTNPVQCYGGNMTINNVSVTQSGENAANWYNSALQVINVIVQNDAGKWQTTHQANATVNSGNFSGKIAVQISAPGGNVTINGGTFIGSQYVLQDDFAPQNYIDGNKFTSKITINGGNFTGAIKVSAATELVINGGTFSINPSQWVAAGKTVVTNSNGTWTVK